MSPQFGPVDRQDLNDDLPSGGRFHFDDLVA